MYVMMAPMGADTLNSNSRVRICGLVRPSVKSVVVNPNAVGPAIHQPSLADNPSLLTLVHNDRHEHNQPEAAASAQTARTERDTVCHRMDYQPEGRI